MKLIRVIICFAIISAWTTPISATASSESLLETLEPTQVFTIVPKYGYSASPIRVRFSQSEIQITNRLQRIATSWASNNPTLPMPAYFLVEAGVENSKTLQLGKQAMEAVASLLVRPVESQPTRTYVVVGRSQSFLKSAVNKVGCFPDLSVTGGVFLMGATLCDRQVIVINLTGYFFLRSRGQLLQAFMESLAEPPLAATSYLIADRNLAGLAHEWVHVARAQISRGVVPDNEPAWIREGLAEVVSGLARVRASNGRMTYRDFHAIRLRKFITWPATCNLSTTDYRGNSTVLGGCEYHRGSVAVELLLANYGGLDKIIRLYNDASQTGDFFASFRRVYGMSIRSFELRADRYASYISKAATYKAKK